jgi:hypothetical protein
VNSTAGVTLGASRPILSYEPSGKDLLEKNTNKGKSTFCSIDLSAGQECCLVTEEEKNDSFSLPLDLEKALAVQKTPFSGIKIL